MFCLLLSVRISILFGSFSYLYFCLHWYSLSFMIRQINDLKKRVEKQHRLFLMYGLLQQSETSLVLFETHQSNEHQNVIIRVEQAVVNGCSYN